jgi:tetratricopeptide (TPR) repeat protein
LKQRFDERSVGHEVSMKDLAPILKELLARGSEASGKGNHPKAREYYQAALVEARRIKDSQGEARALLYLAGIARVSDKDLPAARKMLNESNRIFQKLHFDRGSAYAMCELGSVAYEEGKLDEGVKWLNSSIALFEKEGDKKGKAIALHQIGLIYKHKKDFASAEKSWRESLLIFEALGERYSIGQVLLSLGNISIDYHKDTEQGRLLLNKALALFEELGLAHEAEKARHNLANIENPDS